MLWKKLCDRHYIKYFTLHIRSIYVRMYPHHHHWVWQYFIVGINMKTCCPTFCISATCLTICLIRKKLTEIHWQHYNNTLVKILTMWSSDNFKNFQDLIWLPAGLPWDPLALGVWLQIFHTKKEIATNLWNCCSNEDISTVPQILFSSFIIV